MKLLQNNAIVSNTIATLMQFPFFDVRGIFPRKFHRNVGIPSGNDPFLRFCRAEMQRRKEKFGGRCVRKKGGLAVHNLSIDCFVKARRSRTCMGGLIE